MDPSADQFFLEINVQLDLVSKLLWVLNNFNCDMGS